MDVSTDLSLLTGFIHQHITGGKGFTVAAVTGYGKSYTLSRLGEDLSKELRVQQLDALRILQRSPTAPEVVFAEELGQCRRGVEVLLVDNFQLFFLGDASEWKPIWYRFLEFKSKIGRPCVAVLSVRNLQEIPKEVLALVGFHHHLALPSEAERRRLLQQRWPRPVTTEDDDIISTLVDLTSGYTPSDLLEIIALVSGRISSRPEPLTEASNLVESTFVAQTTLPAGSTLKEVALTATKQVIPSVLRYGLPAGLSLSTPKLKFEDVTGCESVKQRLLVDVIEPLRKKKATSSLPAGVLLEGPPGTGKTLLARAIAGELRSSFLYVPISQLMSSGVGESEKMISQIFTIAAACNPCVIFIDEFQACFAKRELAGENMAPLTSQLLLEMSAIQQRRQSQRSKSTADSGSEMITSREEKETEVKVEDKVLQEFEQALEEGQGGELLDWDPDHGFMTGDMSAAYHAAADEASSSSEGRRLVGGIPMPANAPAYALDPRMMQGLVAAARSEELKSEESVLGTLVIAATNRLDLIDSSFLTLGRFELVLHMDTLSDEGRRHLIANALKKMKVEAPLIEEYLEPLVHASYGLTGAAIQAHFRRAVAEWLSLSKSEKSPGALVAGVLESMKTKQ